jgi:hypothetical protein
MGAPLHTHERIVALQRQDHRNGRSMPYEVLWFDGGSGALWHEGLDGYPDSKEVEALRRLASHDSTALDAQGRRAWLYEGFLHREGAQAIGIPPLAGEFRNAWPCRPGEDALWVRFMPGQGGGSAARYLWIDATTGQHVARDQEVLQPAFPLSKGRLLVQRRPTQDLKTATWQVLDVATGVTEPAQGAISSWPRTSWPICRLAGDRILRYTAVGEQGGLDVWDPVTGATKPLSIDVPGQRRRLPRVLGAEPNGRILLEVPRAGVGDASTWVLLSPDAAEARVVFEGHAGFFYPQPVHLAADGSVLCLAMSRPARPGERLACDRIVRVGPAVGQVQVLFPKVEE